MSKEVYPLGKLPADVLAGILKHAPILDPRVLLGPGIGLDCAVIDLGDRMLVFKSDPITFASDEIGWYAVQVCTNDIATTGAEPRWFLPTVLLPEKKTTQDLVEKISNQIFDACRELGISVVGGHTEITYGIDRPILLGSLVGEVSRESLITPRGAGPGDRILLTKGVPIEAAAILAREFPDRLQDELTPEELRQAADFLFDPGISVLRDARTAIKAGQVTAMHDPTEGGLAAALWEMAEACQCPLDVDTAAVPIPPLAGRICRVFGLDPLATIASGALLLTVRAQDARVVQGALESEGIPCAELGAVGEGEPVVRSLIGDPIERPQRDDLAKVYEG